MREKGGDGYDKNSIGACSDASADLQRGSRPDKGYKKSPPSRPKVAENLFHKPEATVLLATLSI